MKIIKTILAWIKESLHLIYLTCSFFFSGGDGGGGGGGGGTAEHWLRRESIYANIHLNIVVGALYGNDL